MTRSTRSEQDAVKVVHKRSAPDSTTTMIVARRGVGLIGVRRSRHDGKLESYGDARGREDRREMGWGGVGR